MVDPIALEAFRKCGSGPFAGVIKQVGNKFGFIESEPVSRHFDKDVFVTKDVLPPGVDAGARVTFKLKLSEKGDPQAETLYVSPAKHHKPNTQRSNANAHQNEIHSNGSPQFPYGLNMQQQYCMQHMQLQFQQMQSLYASQLTLPTYENVGSHSRDVAMELFPNVASSHLRLHTNDLLTGIVKTLRRDKGFGFIDCAQTHNEFHRDVFLEKEETASLQVGMEVEFLLFVNAKNQPVGKVMPPQGIFTGTLKVYNNLRGYGFVECVDSTRIYGTDVFIHKKEVELYPTKVGDQVEFTIFLNSHGQPQATRTQIYRGTIVARGKFLFISCKETKRKFGHDVFLVKSLIKNLKVDDEVDFTVIVNKGKPQANSANATANATELLEEESDSVVYEGVVKSLGAKYGFVESEKANVRYGSDIFLLMSPSIVNSLAIGDTVLFKVQMNEKNQPQAVHPRLLQKQIDSYISTKKRTPSK